MTKGIILFKGSVKQLKEDYLAKAKLTINNLVKVSEVVDYNVNVINYMDNTLEGVNDGNNR